MKTLRVLLAILILSVPLQAQEQRCDRSVSITVSAGASATVASASAFQTVYICSFLLTGNTAATGIQFLTGTAALTGVMLTPVNGPLDHSQDTFFLFGNYGAAITIAATTGAVTGVVSFAQR